MQYRFLGGTGIRVSALALGTMAFGSDASEEESQAIFARALDAGINLFDCADVYGKGSAETLLGRFVGAGPGSVRDDVVLATKAYFPMRDSANARGSSRYHLVRAVEASLRRLNTDRIDLFFLHRYDEATDLEETLRAVEMLVTSGKILHVAVSNFSAWQTMKAVGIANARGWSPVCCLQPMYNLAKRQAESELFPMAAAERLGVLTYSPLGGGLLSGKYGKTQRPSAGRIVDNPMYATRYAASSNFEIAERFTQLAAEAGVHPVTLAVAWAGAHPAVTAPLVGGRSVTQLEPALAAANYALPPELYEALCELSAAPAPATDRNEESSAHNYGSR